MAENATPLLFKGYDLYKLLTDEAVCLNDTQNLQLVERILVDGSTIIGSLAGFEGKFNTLRSGEEIKSLDQMNEDLDKAIAEYEEQHKDDKPEPSYFEQINMDDF